MIRFYLILLAILLVGAFPASLAAQPVSQTLSVTPPLFQISVAPGDAWQSAIKVVNSNPYPITIFAEPVNFAPAGEDGKGRFIPLVDDPSAENATLAEWIELKSGSVTIPPEQSRDVTFTVAVPEDAPPGGHSAAILVATEPPAEDGAVAVRTSQVVSSLFFLRVEGDVVESGRIREFSVSDRFVETPGAEFSFRFENTGNVHLQPRGDIVIRNMWGKERGVIPINHQTSFGNVLPESIREYTFNWSGEPSLTDIGRYEAVLTVGYGENGVKSDSAKLAFYVIPLKATVITLGTIVLVIAFIAWAIRLYIRRMLTIAGVDVDTMEHVGARRIKMRGSDLSVNAGVPVTGPIRAALQDLSTRLSRVGRVTDRIRALGAFVLQYKRFFSILVLLLVVFVGAGVYFKDVLTEQRAYEVTIEENGEERTVSSEEIIKERLDASATSTPDINTDQPFMLSLVNASGESGRAAELAVRLESLGYRIDGLTADPSRTQRAHVIVADEPLLDEAEVLSDALGDVLISSRVPGEGEEPALTIIVGSASLPE